jgi:hypothetical protein
MRVLHGGLVEAAHPLEVAVAQERIAGDEELGPT